LIGPKKKVIIQTLAETVDSYGSTTKTWTNVKELNATVTVVGSGEYSKMNREQMDFTHRLFLDYQRVKSIIDKIRSNGRVWIHGRLYDIVSIENHFNKQVVVLLRLER